MAKLNTSILIVLTLIALAVVVYLVQQQPIEKYTPGKFSSLDELKSFLKEKQTQGYYGVAYETLGAPMQKAVTGASPSSPDYSQTNIQVQGVDEADIVKNDGEYIYIVSGENISIIDAYPAENAKILSNLNINGTAQEIFVNDDKLIVFGREKYVYNPEPIPIIQGKAIARPDIFPPIYYSQKSFIKIYDISNKENPSLEKNIAFDGDYYDSRMIDNYVYAIVNQPINYVKDEVLLPAMSSNGENIPVLAQDIYYFDIPDYGYRLTTILAINVNGGEPEKKTFLTGYTQNIFVSQNNIYLTSTKQISEVDRTDILVKKVIIPLVDSNTASKIKEIMNSELSNNEKLSKIQAAYEEYFNKLPENEKEGFRKKLEEKAKEVEAEIQKELQKTIIHKISIKDNNIDYKARGEVPGVVLNQFSMDEYKDNFRIATTTGEVWSGNSLNHMYILDDNMEIVGKLEDLAHGEKIYSARFIGDRAYLVTFKKIDPLFVIDLSNAENPRVLGKLKIPGYSDYLHPYDETHIIGIGKEAIDAENPESNFAWYQGIKISLFDVSDVENPKEISKFNIGDRGTDSEALREHKAFLFDKNKELLVIPISLHEINREKYQGEVPTNTYGDLTFEGAYVLSLNLQDGFKLKGRITHLSNEEIAKFKEQQYYYPSYNTQIRRSLYIDNVLYTISQKEVKANNLDNLEEINVIKLFYQQENYPIIY